VNADCTLKICDFGLARFVGTPGSTPLDQKLTGLCCFFRFAPNPVSTDSNLTACSQSMLSLVGIELQSCCALPQNTISRLMCGASAALWPSCYEGSRCSKAKTVSGFFLLQYLMLMLVETVYDQLEMIFDAVGPPSKDVMMSITSSRPAQQWVNGYVSGRIWSKPSLASKVSRAEPLGNSVTLLAVLFK